MGNADIGARLKQARETAGLKQKEVCEKLNIPKTQTISSYERGINNPPVETLGLLAKLYNVSTDWLIFGEETSSSKKKSKSDRILELLTAADDLNLMLEEESDINGNSTGYSLRLNNPFLTQFDPLICDIYKLRKVKDILEEDDYKILLQKRILTKASESNDFKWDPFWKDAIYDSSDSDLPF